MMRNAAIHSPSLWVLAAMTVALLATSPASAYGMEGDSGRAAVLVRDLGGPNDRSTADELVKIGGPAVDALVAGFASRGPAVRRRSAELIGEIRDYSTIKPLQRLARDSDAGVQRAAIRSLVKHLVVEWHAIHGEPAGGPDTYAPLIELGPRVVDILLDLLDDPDRSMRLPAIVTLGRVHDRRALEPLLRMLDDESEWTMGAASDALSRYDDPRIVPALVARLDKVPPDYAHSPVVPVLASMGDKAVGPLAAAMRSNNTQVVYGAAAALAESRSRRAVPALVAALSEAHSAAREVVIGSSARLRDRRFVPVLLGLVTDPSERTRVDVIRCLGGLGDRRVVPTLVALLYGASQNSRAAASGALGALRDRRAVPALIELLAHPSGNVTAAVARALGRIGDRRACPSLLTALRSEDSKTALAAAEALGQMRVSEAAQPILRLGRETEDYFARSTCARALARLGKAGVTAAVKALGDQSPNVRMIAVEVLREAKAPASRGALIVSLSDEDSDVRCFAASALGEIGDERAVDPLLRLLSDSDAYVRGASCEALGKIKAIRAIDALVLQLADTDFHAFEGAIDALTRLGEPAAPAVLSLLGSSSTGLRSRAVYILARWKNPAYADSLARCLTDPVESIRIDAALALGRMGDRRALRPLGALARHPRGYYRAQARDVVLVLEGWTGRPERFPAKPISNRDGVEEPGARFDYRMD